MKKYALNFVIFVGLAVILAYFAVEYPKQQKQKELIAKIEKLDNAVQVENKSFEDAAFEAFECYTDKDIKYIAELYEHYLWLNQNNASTKREMEEVSKDEELWNDFAKMPLDASNRRHVKINQDRTAKKKSVVLEKDRYMKSQMDSVMNCFANFTPTSGELPSLNENQNVISARKKLESLKKSLNSAEDTSEVVKKLFNVNDDQDIIRILNTCTETVKIHTEFLKDITPLKIKNDFEQETMARYKYHSKEENETAAKFYKARNSIYNYTVKSMEKKSEEKIAQLLISL